MKSSAIKILKSRSKNII